MTVHKDHIADALQDMLADGDVLLAWRDGGQVQVVDVQSGTGGSPLQRSHPELYGYLASVNSQNSNATGCGWMVFCLMAAVVGCAAIYQFFPNLRVSWWWVMPLYVLVMAYVWFQVNAWCEAAAFRRHGHELQTQLDSAGLARLRVVGMIEGDERLDNVAQFLKDDVHSTYH